MDTTPGGNGRYSYWDTQNRLTSCIVVSSSDGTSTTSRFTYGSDGLRRRGVVTSYAAPTPVGDSPIHLGRPSAQSFGTVTPVQGPVTGSTQTDYIYDGSMLVEQVVRHFDASGAALDTPTTITYLQGPSGPLYRKSSAVADPSWYVYDGLGSVVGEVDVNGNMTASKEFDVYGLTRNVTGTPTTRQGFVGGLGHESDDETGLIYMQHRYCDPGVARFISEDPAHDQQNWFPYCANDPVNKLDPTGKILVDLACSTVEECSDKIEELAQGSAILGRVYGVVAMIDLRMAAMSAMLTGLFEDTKGGQMVLQYTSSITLKTQTFRFDFPANAIDLEGFASNNFNTSGSGHAYDILQALQDAAAYFQ